MPTSRHASFPGQFVLLCCLTAGSLGLATPALAQTRSGDSSFLACARFEDRGQRIACLEDALEAAVSEQAGTTNSGAAAPGVSATPAPAPAVPAPSEPDVPAAPSAAAAAAPAATPAPAATDTESTDRSLLDRIRNFGQDESTVSLSTDDSGQDRLHDSITALEKRNNLWIVTLSSGQVWRQTYPRNLLLRIGDEIAIDQEGIGSSYRLSTPRLSGFIRVERAK